VDVIKNGFVTLNYADAHELFVEMIEGLQDAKTTPAQAVAACGLVIGHLTAFQGASPSVDERVEFLQELVSWAAAWSPMGKGEN